MALIFSAFPQGKYQVTLVSSSGTYDLSLTDLKFDQQTGTVTGIFMIEYIVTNGFHDCEHAYFTLSNPNSPYTDYFACNVFGTGSPMIDEMIATCTHNSPMITEVYSGTLIPM